MEKDANQECNFVVYPKMTWWQRIRRRLFPANFCRSPEPDFEMKDMLTTKTVCVLSIVDRLRIIFGGRLIVETKTATENEVGRCAGTSVCYVATKGMTDK